MDGVAGFLSVVLALVDRGYKVEVERVRRSSYRAIVRNDLGMARGEFQYRDPGDEPEPEAQGLSYGPYNDDPATDRVMRIVQQLLRGEV